MKRLLTTIQMLALVLATATLLHAQETRPADTKRQTRVTVGGDSIIQAQPDTAILTVAVGKFNSDAGAGLQVGGCAHNQSLLGALR
jgi:uncharacterized protein YggE